jgi:hypothetical protein
VEIQFMRLFHQPIQAACPIEQRILGVQMQVNKVGVRHNSNLTPGRNTGQAKCLTTQIHSLFTHCRSG